MCPAAGNLPVAPKREQQLPSWFCPTPVCPTPACPSRPPRKHKNRSSSANRCSSCPKLASRSTAPVQPCPLLLPCPPPPRCPPPPPPPPPPAPLPIFSSLCPLSTTPKPECSPKVCPPCPPPSSLDCPPIPTCPPPPPPQICTPPAAVTCPPPPPPPECPKQKQASDSYLVSPADDCRDNAKVSHDCCVNCPSDTCVYSDERDSYRRRLRHVQRHKRANNNLVDKYDLYADAKCNDDKLKLLMEKNISKDSSAAKRQIQAVVEREFRTKFNVICSYDNFSYIVHTNTFCQHAVNGINCYAFSVN
ncbi:unnamed protein product [Enterobius vermicularis]|uniref:Ground-like domain-containing protein n=1 Tax=Enterobius vermicularis TaxID=51028 RepID=A0A0N4UTJ3_ENTVE|nr:unnamed protein product [Enterobius vermicularis]